MLTPTGKNIRENLRQPPPAPSASCPAFSSPPLEKLPSRCIIPISLRSLPKRGESAFGLCGTQPRIVCHDLQRETHGWDGPGAYEWDEAAASSARNSDSNGNDITDKDHASLGSSTRGLRPRGISIRDPQRESRVFREGSTGFISPCQTNVRGFAVVPASGRGALVREGTGVARGQAEVVSGGDGRGSPSKKQGRGGNSGRKRPQKVSNQKTKRMRKRVGVVGPRVGGGGGGGVLRCSRPFLDSRASGERASGSAPLHRTGLLLVDRSILLAKTPTKTIQGAISFPVGRLDRSSLHTWRTPNDCEVCIVL